VRRPIALLATSIVVLLAAACSAGQPSPSAAPLPTSASVSDAAFTLELGAPRTTWHADEPITVTATLTWLGPDASVEVFGSGEGVVSFDLEQTDGPLDVGAAVTADCGPHAMTRGQAATIPFVKSGGYTAEDPVASAKASYLSDPQLRLPAGSYVVRAVLDGWIGTCGADGTEHRLSVDLPLTVTP